MHEDTDKKKCIYRRERSYGRSGSPWANPPPFLGGRSGTKKKKHQKKHAEEREGQVAGVTTRYAHQREADNQSIRLRTRILPALCYRDNKKNRTRIEKGPPLKKNSHFFFCQEIFWLSISFSKIVNSVATTSRTVVSRGMWFYSEVTRKTLRKKIVRYSDVGVCCQKFFCRVYTRGISLRNRQWDWIATRNCSVSYIVFLYIFLQQIFTNKNHLTNQSKSTWVCVDTCRRAHPSV